MSYIRDLTVVGGPRDKNLGLGGLMMANSKSSDHNFLSSGWVLELLGWPQCWFQEISAIYSYIPLDLNQLLDIGVHLWWHFLFADSAGHKISHSSCQLHYLFNLVVKTHLHSAYCYKRVLENHCNHLSIHALNISIIPGYHLYIYI